MQVQVQPVGPKNYKRLRSSLTGRASEFDSEGCRFDSCLRNQKERIKLADYLTGCTHFGHENIIRLAERPFADVAEMDAALIEGWNEVVALGDTVYHLGDFAMRGAPAEEYKEQLNGSIIEIQGNHDPKGWGHNYLTMHRKKLKIVLFHYPIEEWDGWWRGAVHFHCHTHSKEFVSAERRGNVGVDATGYKPIRLDEAIEKIL